MCLAKLAVREGDAETVLMEMTSRIRLDGRELTAVDLFGKTVQTAAVECEVDFQGAEIIIHR